MDGPPYSKRNEKLQNCLNFLRHRLWAAAYNFSIFAGKGRPSSSAPRTTWSWQQCLEQCFWHQRKLPVTLSAPGPPRRGLTPLSTLEGKVSSANRLLWRICCHPAQDTHTHTCSISQTSSRSVILKTNCDISPRSAKLQGCSRFFGRFQGWD